MLVNLDGLVAPMTEFTKELRQWSTNFMCEPLSQGISRCEYAGELLQRAATLIEQMHNDLVYIREDREGHAKASEMKSALLTKHGIDLVAAMKRGEA